MVLGINKADVKVSLPEALEALIGTELDDLDVRVERLGQFLQDKSSLETMVADRKANYATIPDVKKLITSYGHKEQDVASILKTYFDGRK